MAKFDVVCLGYSAVDYLGVVPHYPEEDTKMELLEFSKQGGGPAATASVTLARLGARVAFLGKVGDDDFGRFMLAELAKEGVCTDYVVVQKGASSQFAFIVIDRNTGKRTIFWTRSGVMPLQAEELNHEVITSCRVLLTDGHDTWAAVKAAELANEAGIAVVYDAGSVREASIELAEHTDALVASERFAREYTGKTDPNEAAQIMLSKRRRYSVVTLGER
ncbi:MAG: PfkB family carbohydrate kinase, partial [Armatimonadota bacterium]|nr:PfkB family carbohydrate kinase [Armatimonadota bacterium]